MVTPSCGDLLTVSRDASTRCMAERWHTIGNPAAVTALQAACTYHCTCLGAELHMQLMSEVEVFMAILFLGRPAPQPWHLSHSRP